MQNKDLSSLKLWLEKATVEKQAALALPFECTSLNAHAGSTMFEGVSGLVGLEGYDLTLTRSDGKTSVVKSALPAAHPLKVAVQIMKEATPNSYGFDVTVDKPFRVIYLNLPPGLQLVGATQPTGLMCGFQAQRDGSGKINCQRIGPGSAPAGREKFTLTFSAPVQSRLTYGVFGVTPFSSATGQAAVR